MARFPRISPRYLIIGSISIVAFAAIGMATGMFQCRGYEFCPQRFVRRSFMFYQLPIVRWRVSPVFRDGVTNDLEAYIGLHMLKTPSPHPAAQRWDVVKFSAWRTEWKGEAHLLCELLEARDDDYDLRWLRWSHNHPDRAKTLWPLVARLAQEEHYSLIPELMTLARTSATNAEFAQQAKAFLIPRFQRLAQAASQSGDQAAAADLHAWLQELEPPQ